MCCLEFERRAVLEIVKWLACEDLPVLVFATNVAK